jgi:predicted small metal-binding protein
MVRKKISCRAMGMNCGFEVHDESVDEIVAALAEHAKRVHKLELTEALRQKARDLVRLEEG